MKRGRHAAKNSSCGGGYFGDPGRPSRYAVIGEHRVILHVHSEMGMEEYVPEDAGYCSLNTRKQNLCFLQLDDLRLRTEEAEVVNCKPVWNECPIAQLGLNEGYRNLRESGEVVLVDVRNVTATCDQETTVSLR